MFGSGWTEVVALLVACAVAALSAPAGISGAVLLLPFQVSVLGTPSPSVTPTNLLYNVVATPGALYRYWRQGQTGGRLAVVLVAGTLPGVIAGSLIRVKLLPGPRVFDIMVAAVLLPLGCWLTLTRPASPGARHPEATPPRAALPEAASPAGALPDASPAVPLTDTTSPGAPLPDPRPAHRVHPAHPGRPAHPPHPGRPDALARPVRRIAVPALVALSVLVGCVGGIYGIGGGSILAPILIGSGRRPAEVAPAALASTFLTSVAGVVTFSILSVQQHLPVAPDWPTGIALGVGGLAGGYAGARLQARLPDLMIRRLVGILVLAIAARYIASGIG